MSELTFDPNNTVLARMEHMSRTEAIELGKAVCGVSGNYVYYAVTPDSDKAESIIKEFIG